MNESNTLKKQKFVGLFAMIQDAEIYEQTLDTLVEWFGGKYPMKPTRSSERVLTRLQSGLK